MSANLKDTIETAGTHTATPWTVRSLENYFPGIDGDGYSISLISTQEGSGGIRGKTLEIAEANAAFIVKAVNGFDMLVEALEDFVKEAKAMGHGGDETKLGCPLCSIADKGIAALKEAKS